jgi:hypothetical protein
VCWAHGDCVCHPYSIRDWLDALAGATLSVPPITRPGDFLLLLGLLRWRTLEGRLFAALALVPQTTVIYEALPGPSLHPDQARGVRASGADLCRGLRPLPGVWRTHHRGPAVGHTLAVASTLLLSPGPRAYPPASAEHK